MPDQSVMPPAGPASRPPAVVWDVSEQGEALLAVLFPHLAGLRVHRVEDAGDAVVIAASCRAALGVLPAVRVGVVAGARRVCAHGG